jgi:hypothetical protein
MSMGLRLLQRRRPVIWRPSRLASALLFAIALISLPLLQPARARQADQTFSPASGPVEVIAQGVAALPAGDAVWRTVRTRAPLPADAPFEERPLGFVLASTGPMLLVDQATGEQVRLGTGEAALTRAGTLQQRSSLEAQPVSYLSIELVAADAPPPPADAIVLQPGQPFPTPPGLHDLDLLSATLGQGETFTIPDSGAKNVVLITDGAAGVGRGEGEPVVLLAGEAASFSGALDIAPATDGGEEAFVSFVVAMIGPELPPVAGIAETSAVPTVESAAAPGTPDAAAGQGSIAIQVFSCPPGMDAQNVAAAVCAPTAEGFDVILSGDALQSPMSLTEATGESNSFTWSGLPFGDYLIAEVALPPGATTYSLSAANVSGDPESGYRITLDEANPALSVRIYAFSPG